MPRVVWLQNTSKYILLIWNHLSWPNLTYALLLFSMHAVWRNYLKEILLKETILTYVSKWFRRNLSDYISMNFLNSHCKDVLVIRNNWFYTHLWKQYANVNIQFKLLPFYDCSKAQSFQSLFDKLAYLKAGICSKVNERVYKNS